MTGPHPTCRLPRHAPSRRGPAAVPTHSCVATWRTRPYIGRSGPPRSANWPLVRAPPAAKAIKDHTLANLDTYLLRLERSVTRRCHVHGSGRGRGERIVTGLVRATARTRWSR